VQAAAEKAQMVHNHKVKNVDTDAIAADELWSFVEKNKNTAAQRAELTDRAWTWNDIATFPTLV
jgi:hypothetical protein